MNKSDRVETTELFAAGNCGMRKNRIEKSANSVLHSNWNEETEQLDVKFDKNRTDQNSIELAIAISRHDTRTFKAEDDTLQ